MLNTLSELIIGVVIARRPKADAAISNLVEGGRLLRRSAPRNDICGLDINRLRSVAFKLCVFVCVIAANPCFAAPIKEAKLWEPIDWSFENLTHAGNPFDLVAKATFTHKETGRKIQTELFYGGGNAWKLRFTGTLAGRWQFVTESDDPDLNNLKGQVNILLNPGVPGFITNFGSKWGRLGTDKAFVPQLAMYCDPEAFARDPARIDADIREFFDGHGFNGFHITVLCHWFDFDKTRSNEVPADPNPDPRTFEILELLLRKVYAAGGIVHIWPGATSSDE